VRLAVTPTHVWPNKEHHAGLPRGLRAQASADVALARRQAVVSEVLAHVRKSGYRFSEKGHAPTQVYKEGPMSRVNRRQVLAAAAFVRSRRSAPLPRATPSVRSALIIPTRRAAWRNRSCASWRCGWSRAQSRSSCSRPSRARPATSGTQEVARAEPDGYTLAGRRHQQFLINQFLIQG